LVTIDDLDRAEAAVEMARADLEVARMQPEILKAQHASALAQLSAVQERVALLTVRAPFSGGVSRRYIHPGGVLQSAISGASEPIIEIVQGRTLRLVVNYPESDLARVHVGTNVTVNFPEIAGYEIDAEISRVAAALNTGSKTLRAEIDIDNQEGRLKPGMYGKVQTMQKTSAAVLTINTLAITAVKNQNFVYKVEDGVVRRIPVTLGLEDRYRIEVFSAELDSDDLVIVKGKTLINEGMSVDTKLADE
jgi:RND family efflux transporter MFP subunit